MTAKEYLRQLWHLDRRINIRLQELERLKADIGIRQMPNNPDRVTGSGCPQDPVSDTVIRIHDMEERLDAQVDKYINLKAKIVEQIDGMENQMYQDILKCRYVLMQNWEQVALTMKYTERQCYRIHGRALQEFGRLYLSKDKKCQ